MNQLITTATHLNIRPHFGVFGKKNILINNMANYKFELCDFRAITMLILKYQIKIEQVINI